MRPPKWTVWTAALLTAALYGVMVIWSLPYIATEAGGLRPFDLRPTGYSESEAREFLGALTVEGRRFYISVQHRLDLVYPALLAITLVLIFLRMFRGPARLLVLLPIAAALFDYIENDSVADLLLRDPAQIDSAAIQAASTATILKSAFGAASFATLLIGFFLLRKRKRNV